MPIIPKIFLCCDLDRTVLPNGSAPLSDHANDIFKAIVAMDEITLAYVSGRDLGLIRSAISEFDIPFPDMAVGDVGTTLFEAVTGDNGKQDFELVKEWTDEIAPDWQGFENADLAAMVTDLDGIRLQEDGKQSNYKLSFYADVNVNHELLAGKMRQRFKAENLNVEIIWSVDEENNIGLVDVLPANATKSHAVRFMMQSRGVTRDRTLYAGDSGNDASVLTSEIPAVLVKNAMNDVRRSIVSKSRQNGTENSRYIAKGDFFGLNGNYVSGILEGLYHFHPSLRTDIERACRRFRTI